MEDKQFKNRLLSLDVFRGITVAAMILVNNPGNWGYIYAPLKHANWHGCTPTDLIFPFFLFIVGVAIVFALYEAKQNLPHKNLYVKILKRGTILFALGLFLNLFPYFDFENVRILGVLQRIGLVYIFCGMLFLLTNRHSQYFIFWGILIAYYLLLSFVPIPGYGPANLDKGTNLAAWLDRLILTQNHIWKHSVTWDPEGILSTLPAIATAIFGMIIGYIIKETKKSVVETSLRMIYRGVIAVVLGICFNFYFPINKSLWTSSYVFFTGGLATLFLAILYWLIDVNGNKKCLNLFTLYGLNAITVFFGSTIIAKLCAVPFFIKDGVNVGAKEWIYQSYFLPNISNPYLASLMGAVVLVLIWYFILWVLNKKNVHIKI